MGIESAIIPFLLRSLRQFTNSFAASCFFVSFCKMAASRRLAKELSEIKKSDIVNYCEVLPSEVNVLTWDGILKPTVPPFDKFKFEFRMEFPSEYPFKAPKIVFKTRIYHPNVDEKGQLCMPIILPENWKPATKAEQKSLLLLINCPEPENALRQDIAEEFIRDKKKFVKNAEEFCSKHAQRV